MSTNVDYTTFPDFWQGQRARVFSYMRKHLDSMQDAEDAVSEVCERLLHVWSGLDLNSNISSYVLFVARSVLVDRYREHKDLPLNEFIEIEVPEDTTLEDNELVHRAIRLMTPRNRFFIRLVMLGYKPRDIVQQFGMSDNTVHRSLSTARQQFRRLYQEVVANG